MLLDVAWPETFVRYSSETPASTGDAGRVDVRRFVAPDQLGEVAVALSTLSAPEPSRTVETFDGWQRGSHEVVRARTRPVLCRNGNGASHAAELSGTELLTVTYVVWVEATAVILRSGRALAVVIGAAMVELDEIARNLNVRSA